MTSQAMVKLADELELAKTSWLPMGGHVVEYALSLDERDLAIAALRLAAAPAASGGVRAGFKPIYVKRWRTLILVPESLADEMRDAFAALTAPPLPADGVREALQAADNFLDALSIFPENQVRLQIKRAVAGIDAGRLRNLADIFNSEIETVQNDASPHEQGEG